jgi:hypothetical protein
MMVIERRCLILAKVEELVVRWDMVSLMAAKVRG